MTTDSIDIGDLGRMSGDFAKFDTIGDAIVGIITEVRPPFSHTNKNNDRLETVYPIGITPEGGTQQLIWPTRNPDTGGVSPMLEAIVNAVKEAGATAYAVGGKLAVKYTEDRDTGKAKPMKMYAAKYAPPAPTPAAANVADLF